LVELLGAKVVAADVEAAFGLYLTLAQTTGELAPRVNHHQATDTRPSGPHRLVQRAQVGAHHAAPRLMATVAFKDLDVLFQPALLQALRFIQERRLHGLCQIGLVVLDRDEVVGLLLDDLLDDLALATES
jgi:hypothetical protein